MAETKKSNVCLNEINNKTGKQFSTSPSTPTLSTSDGTVFTLAEGDVGFIQNLHTTALAVKKGAGAATNSFHLILRGGTGTDDGIGGFVEISDYIGAVSVKAMTGSPRYIAWTQSGS